MIMNKKILILLAIVLVIGSVGFVAFRTRNNSAQQKQKKVAAKIDEYYKTKPRTVTEDELEKANANLSSAPAESTCGKLGFKYQIVNADGTAVCTEGYH
jgi:predicted negative regulator of RcsB-dependent stress response